VHAHTQERLVEIGLRLTLGLVLLGHHFPSLAGRAALAEAHNHEVREA